MVVAEGAEMGMIDEEREQMRNNLGIQNDQKDASGNIKNVDLAKFMVSDLASYAKKQGTTLTIKYLNPTYAIRTTPPNGSDNDLCHKLAHCAVHSVMGGYTDFSVGIVRDTPCMIPLSLLTSQDSRRFKRRDPEWQRLIGSTGQPNFLDKKNTIEYLQREKELDIKRKEKYLENKLKDMRGCEQLGGEHHFGVPPDENALLGAAGTQNY